MGTMTRLQIVTEGMLLAGRDDIAVRANSWLQTWLDSVAAKWPWPMLLKEKLNVAVTGGAQTVTIGADGSGGVTNKIIRILDNNWLYTSDYRSRRRLRIPQYNTMPGQIIDPATSASMPTEMRIGQAAAGQFILEFSPIPNQNYLLSMDYLEQPAALAGDSSVPWYPNDQTMIDYIAARTMKFDDGPTNAYQVAIGEVADQLKADCIRYGAIKGQNDQLLLDQSVYK